ncbi:MAG: signal peptidase II [Desulfuromonas sp.]|nr:MAG: signal peptidase II [Desulfuromonas sp.]
MTETGLWLRYRLLLFSTVAVLVFDQVTKLWVVGSFRLYESIPLIENFLAFTYVRNKGAAFGILSDSSWRIPFFIGIGLVAVVVILVFYHKTAMDHRFTRFGLALILPGAVGNLIDRIRMGEVIDFIDAHWYQYHWPAFNVADSAITIGVGCLLLASLFLPEGRDTK